jgi:hypothetical protein
VSDGMSASSGGGGDAKVLTIFQGHVDAMEAGIPAEGIRCNMWDCTT